MGDLVSFPDRGYQPKAAAGGAAQPVPQPRQATVLLEGEGLDIFPESRTVDRYECPTPEGSSDPSVAAYPGSVVLDLGDCTPARTLLRWTPDNAEQLAAALLEAARLARG